MGLTLLYPVENFTKNIIWMFEWSGLVCLGFFWILGFLKNGPLYSLVLNCTKKVQL